ncbi:C39 family peptidase [Acetilactobacillus jinshanensis]|uniref:Peptidase C39-like domain-containing protein n=1 Tax=Acetilactobacillus jinshanensis TaxID=1720083 RepID=A0A4V1ALL8_9LACO|nr:C39 family peptidase [Acetilactobacillus jinshanensis]QBP18049.1 hypothetical protein ELX58_02555 [Acetilactobacillus jinshanensis]URL60912.1 hypothetical protein HGK75_02590 [uncultured bacterium]
MTINSKLTDFYTVIANSGKHVGTPIYATYPKQSASGKVIATQHQYRNQIVHVTKMVKSTHQTWAKIDGKISGWINYDGLDHDVRWFKGVPLICQRPELPTGCELVAATMMLQYATGKKLDKMKLVREMPRSTNPNRGFVGSPYKTSGWCVYPGGLMSVVNQYTHDKAWNMTGCTITDIKKQIDRNHPVVIWMTDIDGFPTHALTVYGYDKHHLFLNDPWANARIKRSLSFIRKRRSKDGMRTISYH